MKEKTIRIIICIMTVITILPLLAMSSVSQSIEKNTDGPHLDFLIDPGVIGWNTVVWNYGDEPAYFVYWEIRY